jgi:GNAT superfamily N-acetyltransferase
MLHARKTCVVDHHFLQRVISGESNLCVVALLEGNMCGFGHINHTGVVGLLYVAPEARFMGASTAMLEWLESEVRRLGAGAE